MSRTISTEVRKRVRHAAGDRCGYCLSRQGLVFAPLEIEHIVPVAAGGGDEEENLWLACRMCNGYKGPQTHGLDPVSGRRIRLFNPRTRQWNRHFIWDETGTKIIGITASGRATVAALQLNNVIAVMVRREWVKAGWHPPEM